jgi:peptidoglycan/LPS O-acetylase OafA/YrhL
MELYALLCPLDGVRAIAVLAVLLFHISPVARSSSFTGVMSSLYFLDS